MLMPILIGGCWALTPEISPSVATAIVAPRSVLRFIDPPLNLSFFGRILHEQSDYSVFLSNSSERCQYDLWRQRDFGDYCSKRPQCVVHRIRDRRGRPRGAGFARALGPQFRLRRGRYHVADL